MEIKCSKCGCVRVVPDGWLFKTCPQCHIYNESYMRERRKALLKPIYPKMTDTQLEHMISEQEQCAEQECTDYMKVLRSLMPHDALEDAIQRTKEIAYSKVKKPKRHTDKP